MSHPVVTLPDAELLLLEWLRGQVPDVRLVTDLPRNLEELLPVGQVTRIGGGRVQQVLDQARLDVDCYGASREAARDLAAQIETVLPSLRGTTTAGGCVGHVLIEVGASWRPDWNERVRRYGLSVVLTIRAA